MTPEEIEAICSFVGIRQYWGDLSNEQLYQRINKYHEWLSGLCDHVKCQAKQITELEAQVAALQEIAIDQLAENNYNFEYNMDNIGKYFWQRDEKIQK